MAEVSQSISDHRLVTLTGAGGAGKTRLAIEIANQLTADFGDGVWYIDLSPIANPVVVPVTVARTFGLPDQPGRSTMDTLAQVHRRPQPATAARQLRTSPRRVRGDDRWIT
jgi:predicted ATPase